MSLNPYELPHDINFHKSINIYSNSSIEFIISKYVEENYSHFNLHEKEISKKDIISTINDIKTCLKILDNRLITSISARILNVIPGNIHVWNLITVYRGEDNSIML